MIQQYLVSFDDILRSLKAAQIVQYKNLADATSRLACRSYCYKSLHMYYSVLGENIPDLFAREGG